MPLKRGQFSHNNSQKTPHSSPIWAGYGVSFVDPGSDWYSASDPAIIHVITYIIGPRCNSTWLYYVHFIKYCGLVMPFDDIELSHHWLRNCLAAPSHCLNLCWHTIIEILWHSFQGDVHLNIEDFNPKVMFEIYTTKSQSHLPTKQWNDLVFRPFRWDLVIH